MRKISRISQKREAAYETNFLNLTTKTRADILEEITSKFCQTARKSGFITENI